MEPNWSSTGLANRNASTSGLSSRGAGPRAAGNTKSNSESWDSGTGSRWSKPVPCRGLRCDLFPDLDNCRFLSGPSLWTIRVGDKELADPELELLAGAP
eukprot:CAMPEP_0172901210 /NCGR_PEP_ID=MMETSP1075-20121228/165782_1 /TAXON_ID=2916 /ORGANISM="Ceratium fusus, Strain PA161109" /LENGTH=98 /DNA_ID=CAMNT_0013757549 /DNA_START=321 /DNA_END=614 /DNA_ORIENTATION=-